jgi:hypothetical protein
MKSVFVKVPMITYVCIRNRNENWKTDYNVVNIIYAHSHVSVKFASVDDAVRFQLIEL